MQKWRIISDDGEDSRIITGQGPVFPYKEVAMFAKEHKYGKYKIEEIDDAVESEGV